MAKSLFITGAGILFFLSLYVLQEPAALRHRTSEFIAVSPDRLAGWSRDQQAAALRAYKKSCSVILAQPASATLSPTRLGGAMADWHPSCRVAVDMPAPSQEEARKFFERFFIFLTYADGAEGLYTGYYAPEYHGSDIQTEEYNYPLYALPDDLKVLDLGRFNTTLQGKSIVGEIHNGEFIPYKDRKRIDLGALDQQQLELAWLKNPIDAFFMHIQGSGVIRYENGERRLFGYAGKNGQAYRAIGKFLIESGEISEEDMSMQAIRRWLAENPLQAEALMWKNPSYVFFRPLAQQAPLGAMNVELTAGRSLAVDRDFVPLGMPVWLDLAPATKNADPLRRLLIAQDTGGAIKGRVRGDVYWGIGADAALMAGPMKDRGRAYFLTPKKLARRILSGAAADTGKARR